MTNKAQELVDPVKKIIFGLFGAGGFAREIMPIVRESLLPTYQSAGEYSIQMFFVEVNPPASEINGIPVIAEEEFFKMECSKKLFNVAIGDSGIREKIADTCIKNGAIPQTLRSVNTTIYDNNEIAEGAIICAYSTITSDAKIGKFFHSNIYSYVAHDCVIGDYVTFAPNVHCNGNIHIHNHAYIGTGAVIKQGSLSKPLIIGEGAIVGMGAVVTKDVEPYTTVVGNPAKPFQKQ
ncbi:sugar O-acyltransferase (sialic acid O-acetyltransferase NeuD family) [Mucilaginibacter frigoritolerans]|jgi:sugar O-acyltransferase (sialic acid O-acetyltransferase NeuD family)|uniref:Sugar O-acyltransferase (Sialic acid O-acetyltransferase NeuD family) n=1 Tax=Mucilaginibacter frigoritolerans TaxID=652788 RepID=A0A562U0Q4_9SPHI|nr:acetyltransferase [Mucilaginibacter frigoritolerans]TWI99263.1 sugar O-acyltransferase (sialic acid O-acetyltransferase NeuD family) [Mucilaginibacter frigoritolerans]